MRREGGSSSGPSSRPSSGPDSRGPRRFSKKPFVKRKVCRFCAEKMEIDYKAANVLRQFISERGKILSRRLTGTCTKHQHELTQAIKRARMLAMLPFTNTRF